MLSNKHDELKARRCPFCREPADDDENDKRTMKRVKANDPLAMNQVGKQRLDEGDYDGAFEYWKKAADLGDLDAHYSVGLMYRNGEGVEKDEEKKVHHWEIAAIGGNPTARHFLAQIEEYDNDNMERAMKHYIIAANLGYELSMKALWRHYSAGNMSKEELDATLRAHQAAIDATKSSQRDAAEVALKGWRERATSS
jgi:TPR repeat protein